MAGRLRCSNLGRGGPTRAHAPAPPSSSNRAPPRHTVALLSTSLQPPPSLPPLPLVPPTGYTSRLLADAMVIKGVRHRTYQGAVEAVFGRRGGILLAVVQYPNLVLTAIACELRQGAHRWRVRRLEQRKRAAAAAAAVPVGTTVRFHCMPPPPLTHRHVCRADNITAATSMKYFAQTYKSFADTSLCTAVDETTGAARGQCMHPGTAAAVSRAPNWGSSTGGRASCKRACRLPPASFFSPRLLHGLQAVGVWRHFWRRAALHEPAAQPGECC